MSTSGNSWNSVNIFEELTYIIEGVKKRATEKEEDEEDEEEILGVDKININGCKYKLLAAQTSQMVDPDYEKKRFITVKDQSKHFGTDRIFIIDEDGIVVNVYDDNYDREYDGFGDNYAKKLSEAIYLERKSKGKASFIRKNVVDKIREIEQASQDLSHKEEIEEIKDKRKNK